MSKVLSAVKAIIVRENKILILKQVVNDEAIWDFPGGKIKYGESPHEALKREVHEETGLNIEINRLIDICWFFRIDTKDQIVCNVFYCLANDAVVNIESNPATEPIEEYKWVSKEDLLADKYRLSDESFKKILKRDLC